MGGACNGHYPDEDIWQHGAADNEFFTLRLPFILQFILAEPFWDLFEESLGSFKTLVFIVFAGIACALWQISLESTLGVGYSGVVRILGFLLIGRWRGAVSRAMLPNEIIGLSLIWLFACIALTHFEMLSVANTAHFLGSSLAVSLVSVNRQ